MKKLLFVIFSLVFATGAYSQGCVAIRNVGGISPDLLFEQMGPDDKFIFNVTNRYFEASDTYKGHKFITDTLVTNRIYTLNISVLGLLKNGWSLGIILPVLANSRNNGADHKGPGTLPRYTTHAFGLGDIRITAYKWLLNSSTNKKGNIQLGLGVKLPTADFRFSDYFIRNDTTKVLAPVDQSIQLGDGGTGITAELSAFYSLSNSINVYINGFYLANPREQNGVSNLKGRNPGPAQIESNTTVMSVPDQYSIRGGVNIDFRKIVFTGGLRYESVPVNDLIGGNKGFRRAASIASFEPGLIFKTKNALTYFNAAIPFKRDIKQNIHNDFTPAGFTKCIFTFGVQFKL